MGKLNFPRFDAGDFVEDAFETDGDASNVTGSGSESQSLDQSVSFVAAVVILPFKIIST